MASFNENGIGPDGRNQLGYDVAGWDIHGMSATGEHVLSKWIEIYNRNSYFPLPQKSMNNINLLLKTGFDDSGYDIYGFDRNGVAKNGRDRNGNLTKKNQENLVEKRKRTEEAQKNLIEKNKKELEEIRSIKRQKLINNTVNEPLFLFSTPEKQKILKPICPGAPTKK